MGNCCICVPQDEYVAVEKFGKFEGIKEAGFHCLGPDICGVVIGTRSTSRRVQTLPISCETKTEDNVFVTLTVQVQMLVVEARAQEAIYKLTNPKEQIKAYVDSVILAKIPTLILDDVFHAKEQIAADVKTQLDHVMGGFGYEIVNVLLTQIEPEHRVKSAMNEINQNKRLRVAALERAEADKVLLVKAAEAEAESKFLQGQGSASFFERGESSLRVLPEHLVCEFLLWKTGRSSRRVATAVVHQFFSSRLAVVYQSFSVLAAG